MPLNLDAVLQFNSGSFDASSGSATLDTATTAGNHVVIYACLEGDTITNTQLNVPTGFTEATNAPGAMNFTSPYVFWKLSGAGGETSFTLDFASGGPSQVLWRIEEVVGLDLINPVHVVKGPTPFDDLATTTTRSTGTTASTSSYDVLAKAIFTARGTTAAIPVWSGYTNGFTEEEQVSATDGSHGVAMAIATKPRQALAQHECTASLDAAANARGSMVVFTAEGAKWAPTIDVMTGLEFGTATSMTNTSIAAGMTGSAIFDGVVGSPAITTSTPRTGTYCLELSASAAAECVTWTSPGALSLYGDSSSTWQGPLVTRFNVYFPTSLPSADVELASVEAGSLGNGMVIWYRSASQKIGVKIGTGTEVLSDATVSTNTWTGVDYRYDARVANHTCDWSVDYGSGLVEQTSAVGAGTSAALITTVRLGWSTAKTATVRYDDIACAKVWNNYPIGNVFIQLLKVDPAGTPTTQGASTEFEVFTVNGGTRAAYGAAGVIAALDDVPPTIGASADGITQITTNTTNYAKIPMDTVQAAPDNVLRALRWYFCPWAASATAATMGMRTWDGENEAVIVNLADHGQDSSALMWICRMQRASMGSGSPYYILSQARLDAMEFRFGFSDDATPDVGLHTVFCEVALAPADVFEVGNIEGAFFLHVRQDPVSQGVASYLVTVPAGTRGATFTYSINGEEQTPHYVTPNAGSEVTYEQVIGATSIETATSAGLAADPA